MRVLTFFNHAGGAMKTSLTRDVGYALATFGARVLLIDLDPQANLTDWLGAGPAEVEQTAFETAASDAPLPAPVEVHGLHLIPASVDLAMVEGRMMGVVGAQLHLRNHLRDLRERYDVVLVDSPPSLGQLAVLGALAADQLVVPVPVRDKGLRGLTGLTEALRTYRKVRPDLSVGLYVPTLYNRQRRHDQETLEVLQRTLSPLATPVPQREAVWLDSNTAGEPVLKYAPSSPVAADVLRVTREVVEAVRLPLAVPGE
ncbi:ParA family protein [Deinococcus pimensis]|uniref:ParA family protein n=1 Tax=Deinococcus pimensis TaxID=309888 RepID=UPI000486AB43|nr:ParA family protein [Deinococcus pimensis]